VEDEPRGRDFGGQIRELTRVLREQWWIILVCLVLTTFAAAAYTSTADKEYESAAKLLLHPDNLSSNIAGTGIAGVDPTRQANTDAQLASSPAVAARVRKQLKKAYSPISVKTSVNPDANILTITVRDGSPRSAARVANAFARKFIRFRRDTNKERYERALETVRGRLAQTREGTQDYVALRAQAKQLKLLVSLQTGDAELVQPAVPVTQAVSPDPARNIALGAVIGLLLGLFLAFLRERLDRRVKNEDQLAALLPGVPIIGLVPEPRRKRATQLMAAEGFHTLRANLRLIDHVRPLKTLLVTSAAPGEGKSTVALNLALAMIEKGESALVLDADLRRPSLTERLNADRRVGVSTILAGEGTIDTSVQQRPAHASRNGDGPSVTLDGELPIVAAGPEAPNLQLLLNDRSIGALLEASRARSEVVIFDGPPVGSFADMLPLAREIDGVILTVRLYHSRTDQLKRFAAQLENASIEPVGIVVLGAATGPSRYYSDYLARD
jgi:capsular exopolysaccharide synthesis family protein